MNNAPINSPIAAGEHCTSAWAQWFDQVFAVVFAAQQSGTTADRPTKGLWTGRTYYDTTLNKPVWIKQVRPAVVWVDATGTTA